MKVLLYTENEKMIGKSGLGKAIKHQMKALSYAGVPYTTNPSDDYDILLINTYFPKSYRLAKKAKKRGKKIIETWDEALQAAINMSKDLS